MQCPPGGIDLIYASIMSFETRIATKRRKEVRYQADSLVGMSCIGCGVSSYFEWVLRSALALNQRHMTGLLSRAHGCRIVKVLLRNLLMLFGVRYLKLEGLRTVFYRLCSSERETTKTLRENTRGSGPGRLSLLWAFNLSQIIS